MAAPRITASPSAWRRLQDDVQGLLTGTLFAALGIYLMKCAGLVPGGLVGLALLLHYASGLDLGAVFFAINAPFYLLAWTRMGRAFTFRTAIAVSLLSLLTWWLPQAVTLQQIDGALAAVLGGLLCGAGMLIIFRHGASLGGLNVLVLRLQDRLGWPAGKTQMVLDALIVLGGGWYVGDARRLALSVLAVVAVNLALVYNHRPGRYQPV
ncbi:MAG TPA: YitT family protein [Ramlibacter sp.]|uniref:YitT family protein n=1 Tax=Ramlibacter sp. TaxID=1917967 RepID=UPI002D80BCCD|nr:YitT family protein [Ramlibacter sp.]HET8747219.1 YitT family protein [Ramlibacter sp.]